MAGSFALLDGHNGDEAGPRPPPGLVVLLLGGEVLVGLGPLAGGEARENLLPAVGVDVFWLGDGLVDASLVRQWLLWSRGLELMLSIELLFRCEDSIRYI